MTKSATKKRRSRIPIEDCHLYGLKSPHTLAKRLGFSLDQLNTLAQDGKYRVFNHKKTGRLIQEPGGDLQKLHKRFHKFISRVEAPAYLHSAQKGKSYITNAKAHVGGRACFKLDIKSFYPSVKISKVRALFRDRFKCEEDVAGLIAKLICFQGKLATGSSVSPIISYYAFKDLFDDLHNLATSRGLTMTCYVDDVTMSGDAASRLVMHAARRMIQKAGLRAHKDVFYPENTVPIVTGVASGKTGISLPRERWKKIRSQDKALRNAADDGERSVIYRQLVSRLYEASQIEPRCRPWAEREHRNWKAHQMKLRLP